MKKTDKLYMAFGTDGFYFYPSIEDVNEAIESGEVDETDEIMEFSFKATHKVLPPQLTKIKK